jgi:hypothetical protein
MKVKLPKKNGEWDTKFYDLKGTPYKGVPVEDLIVKGTQITAIIECGGVWFAGSKFGLTWRAKQIAIHKLPEKMNDFAFKGLGSAPAPQEEDEEDEKEEIDDDAVFSQPSTSTSTSSKPSAVAAMLPQAHASQPHASQSHASEPAASQSVDDEDADDVEPVPVPRKTVVKKKIIVPAARK